MRAIDTFVIVISEPIYVYVLYQRGSGRFEVSSDLQLLATGRAYISDEPKDKLFTKLPDVDESNPLCVLEKDHVYTELLRRGLAAGDVLAGINNITYYEKGTSQNMLVSWHSVTALKHDKRKVDFFYDLSTNRLGCIEAASSFI